MRNRTRGMTAAGIATLFSIGIVGAVAAPSYAATDDCAGSTCTVTFAATGAPETFAVPAFVTQISIMVRGAQGGSFDYSPLRTNPGGLGGMTTATLAVTPGTTYTVVVGGQGVSVDPANNDPSPKNGGYGGGGASGRAGLWGSGSGGGGSYLFNQSGALLLAAGGGGGATSSFDGQAIGGAGAGAGSIATSGNVTGSGGAATETSAGSGGTGNGGADGAVGGGPATSAAAFGMGGAGGAGGALSGAGGGGGHYGGGGGGGSPFNGSGSGGPGGGGSGFAAAVAQNVTGTVGIGTGAGSVTISYIKAAASLSLTAQPSASAQAGDAVTLTAAVSGAFGTPTGTIAFTGPGITGCDAVPVDGTGLASCTTSTLATGSPTIVATYSGNSIYAPLTASRGFLVTAVPTSEPTATDVPSTTGNELAESGAPSTTSTAALLAIALLFSGVLALGVGRRVSRGIRGVE